jgi:hypothetical protein
VSVAWWALVVSALSLAVSAGTLTWNVMSFRRSGPIVTAVLDLRYTSEPVDEKPAMYRPWQIIDLSHRYIYQAIVAKIIVVNRGRAAVDVRSVGVTYGDGKEDWRPYRYILDPSKAVPLRLEAGSSREFSAEISDWDAPFALATPRSLKACVELGNGSTVELADISSERFMKQVTQMNYIKMGIEARGNARPSESNQ